MKFDNDQEYAVMTDGNVLVSASAGSGKTAVLTERFLRLAKEGIEPKNILVLTFSEKAAAEMKERIEGKLTDYAAVLNAAAAAELIRGFSYANISTIHSFLNKLLTKYFYEADIDPYFSIISENDAEGLKRRAFDASVKHYNARGGGSYESRVESVSGGNSDGKKLYEGSIENVSGGNSDGKELYGSSVENVSGINNDGKEFNERSGGGSYGSSVENVSGINDDGEALYEQLVQNISGSRSDGKLFAAAEEYRELLTVTLDKEYDFDGSLKASESYILSHIKERLEKFLKFAEEILGECANGEKYTFAAEEIFEKINGILNARDDEKEFIRRVLECEICSARIMKKEESETREKIAALKTAFNDELKNKFKRIVESLGEWKSLAERDRGLIEKFVEFTRFYTAKYDELKRAENKLDYSDLESFAVKLLENKELLEEIKSQYTHILVDEYQDTNRVQEYILNRLSGGELFVVGDVKQSIFSFRLADPSIFLERRAAYAAGAGKFRNLNNNYRTSGRVTGFVNDVFSAVMKKENGGIDYEKDAKLIGKTEFEPEKHAPCSVAFFAKSDEGAEINGLYSVRDDANFAGRSASEFEGLYIANVINKLMNKEIYIPNEKRYRPVGFGDIAVIFRSKRSDNAVNILDVLKSAGIPLSEEVSGDGRRAVAELLKVVGNARNDIPLAAVMTSFFGGFSDGDLKEIRLNDYDGKCFFDCVLKYIEDFKTRENAVGNSAENNEKTREKTRYSTAENYVKTQEKIREKPQKNSIETDGKRQEKIQENSAVSGGEKREKTQENANGSNAEIKENEQENVVGNNEKIQKNAVESDAEIKEKTQKTAQENERENVVGNNEKIQKNAQESDEKTRYRTALADRLDGFVAYIRFLRKKAADGDMYSLVSEIVYGSGYDDYTGGAAEVRGFVESFYGYEHSLQHFLGGKPPAAEEKGEIGGDRVSVLTIHASKGLEFPVVFLADCAKRFNSEDERGPFVFDAKLGIGLYHKDLEKMTKKEGIFRRAIILKKDKQSREEELRLLYVAMTRAKNHLFISGSGAESKGGYGDIIFKEPESFMEFIERAAYRNRSVAESFISAADIGVLFKKAEKLPDITAEYAPEIAEYIAKKLESKAAAVDKSPLKESATAVSKGKKLSFSEPPPGIFDRGNAYHKVMQYVDFNADRRGIEASIRGLVEENILSAREAAAVWVYDIEKCLKSRVIEYAKNNVCVREKEFMLYLPSKEMYADGNDDKILVQGVIDLLILGEKNIIVDYKTGKTEGFIDAYKKQLSVYKKAAESAGIRIDETVIYSFEEGEIRVG
jgi:ATP-dependent exoDNAse (exonuclease V) beta subunit